MPNIKAVSDLRNYSSVLSEVHENEPVYLTKNGRGAYAIVDIKDQEEYERMKAFARLMSELRKAEVDFMNGDTVDHKELVEYFRGKYGKEVSD